MATVKRTKLSEILPALKTRLMEVTGFPSERVILLARQDASYRSQADQYVRIWPRSQMTTQEILTGAGRVDARVVRRVNVCLWTRLALDVATEDGIWLNDEDRGHLDVEHKLYDALTTFHPEDEDGNWLLSAPIRLGPVSEPSKDKTDPEWGKSEVDIEVPFVLDLAQSYQ